MELSAILKLNGVISRQRALALLGALAGVTGFVTPWFNAAGWGRHLWHHSGIRFLILGKLFVVPIFALFAVAIVLCVVSLRNERTTLWQPTVSMVLILSVMHAVSVAVTNTAEYGSLSEMSWQYGLFLLFPGLGVLFTSSIVASILERVLAMATTAPESQGGQESQ